MTVSPGLGKEKYLSQWTPVGVNRLPVKVPSMGMLAGGKWLSGSCTRKAAYPPADNEKTRWKQCLRMSNGRCGRLTTLGRRVRVGRSCHYSSKFVIGAQVVLKNCMFIANGKVSRVDSPRTQLYSSSGLGLIGLG